MRTEDTKESLKLFEVYFQAKMVVKGGKEEYWVEPVFPIKRIGLLIRTINPEAPIFDKPENCHKYIEEVLKPEVERRKNESTSIRSRD